MSTGTFWHIDGHILTCRRALLLFYTLLVSLSSLLFGVAGHHFSMSTGTFGMSTGAFTILHFAILPVQPTFWHRGASFWHVHGHILACRRAHLPLYIPLFSLSNLLFGIAGRLSFWHVSSLVLAHRHGATLSDRVGWGVITSLGFRHRDYILPLRDLLLTNML